MKKLKQVVVLVAVLLFILSGCFTPSLEKQISMSKAITEYDDNVNIDQVDKVKFGKNNNGKSIEWIVLEKNDNNALLLLSSYFEDDLLEEVRYSSHKIERYDSKGCFLMVNAVVFALDYDKHNKFTSDEMEYLRKASYLMKGIYSGNELFGFVLSKAEYNKYLSANKASWNVEWWLRDLKDNCGYYIDTHGIAREVKNVVIDLDEPNRSDRKYNRGGMFSQVDSAEYNYDVALYNKRISALPKYVVRPAVWVAW